MVDKGNQGPKDNLPTDLSQSVEIFRNRLGKSSDFKAREIILPKESSPVAVVFFFNGLVDLKGINKMIATLNDYLLGEKQGQSSPQFIEDLIPGDLRKSGNVENLIQALLDGSTVVLINGLATGVVVSLPGGERRAVEEPSSQTVIRGPKEGFTEDVATNIALIRRKIRFPELRFEDRIIGHITKTRVSVAYIKGIANDEVVNEVFARLDAIETDSILDSGYIEEFIQDVDFTPFPTIINTERPDAVAGNLLDGQVAILVDGSPFVLVAPVTFFKFFLSSEDYYQRYDISTFLRMIRLFSFFVALLLPSLYIAVTTFQQEMIPTTLLISLAAQREGTPLPALLEALLMELTFEVIREAGVRMPRVVGPAISIVGALVLGQAAVQAGLVSAAMVIIVSFTAISNFVIPFFSMSASVRLVRFGLMLLAGSFGFYGIMAGGIPILVHMISLRSFGVPYFLPLAPLSINNLKDVLVRAPWPLLKTRPSYISPDNRGRQATDKKGKNSK